MAQINSQDQLTCTVCNTQTHINSWMAHISGKQHIKSANTCGMGEVWSNFPLATHRLSARYSRQILATLVLFTQQPTLRQTIAAPSPTTTKPYDLLTIASTSDALCQPTGIASCAPKCGSSTNGSLTQTPIANYT